LATGIHRALDFIDKAIIVVHTRRIYIVVRVPFGKTSKTESQYNSYCDCFEKKLRIFDVLTYIIVIILKKKLKIFDVLTYVIVIILKKIKDI